MSEQKKGKVVNGIAFTNLNSTGKKNLLAGTRKQENKNYNIVFRTEVKK